MTTTDVRTRDATGEAQMPGTVDTKLEVVVLPVADADRAKSFYQSLGWRLYQFTPTGSQASIDHLS